MDRKLIAYSDASYANLPDGSFQEAFVVVKSTLAAVEVVETGFLLTSILKELHNSQSSVDTECLTDNQSLTQFIRPVQSLMNVYELIWPSYEKWYTRKKF